VCILDADSTNFGTELALKIPDRPAAMIEYFGGMIFSGGAVACPVDSPAPLNGARVDLATLPKDYYRTTGDGIVFMTAGKLPDYGAAPGCDGPMTKVARDLELIDTRSTSQPVMLVDCKAGYEDSARGLVTGLDWALVVVDPTTAGIQMAFTFCRMAEALRRGDLPATRHLEREEDVQQARDICRRSRLRGISVILNKIRDAATREYVETALRGRGITPIGVLPDEPLLSSAWLKGEPIILNSMQHEMSRIVGSLDQAMRPRTRKAG
jgi:CO dehydrogenase nickel-insertion accessory protein CooC1